MNLTRLRRKVETAVATANFSLRSDVDKLLRRSLRREKNKMAKLALSWIVKNAQVSSSEKIAICQDTGLPIVFIEVGKDMKASSALVKAISEGVEAGYQKNYLRASIVDPLLRGQSTYKGINYHLNFVPKQKGLKITIFPKGFGSENKSQLRMFNPTANFIKIEEFILKAIKDAGPESCPPFFVGVGIGGSSDTALLLAKEALLKNLDKPNPDKSLNVLEKRLLTKINNLGIGPMGLGGKYTALAVRINKTPTHIAGLPVGVNISCHALRSAAIRIKGKG